MPETTPKEVSFEEMKAAADVMEAYGRQCRPNYLTSRGAAIGISTAACCGPMEVVHAAIESLEHWNHHLAVAAILAIFFGRWDRGHRGNPSYGSITRPLHSRWLTIRLPRSWGMPK